MNKETQLRALRPSRKKIKTAINCAAEIIQAGRRFSGKRTAYLRRGKTRSCGDCDALPRLEGTRRLDLTGQRFGKLTALEPVGQGPGGTYKWRCRCDCGRECAAAVANLRNGHTRSCGCESRPPRVHNIEGTCVEVIRSETLRSNNTSGATGVDWLPGLGRWRAVLCFKGERHYLGLYQRFEDAVQARKEAEAKYFGSFLAEYDAGAFARPEKSGVIAP